MSRNHISMRKTREILRLRFDCHCSHREIANSIGIGGTTVRECLERAKKASIEWPLPDDLTDDALEGLLYLSSLRAHNVGEDPAK
jgi:hypothetical protein